MTLISLAKTKEIASPYNLQPFVFAEKTGDFTLASFWTETFGAPDESTAEMVDIEQVVQDALMPYEELDSLAEIRLQNKSFFFDYGNQILYFHVDHQAAPWVSLIEEGESKGYCNRQNVYVDDIYFAPLLKSIPSLDQEEDLLNYEKLAFVKGDIVLDNTQGDLDYLNDVSIMGNAVKIYYLEERKDTNDYTATDLVPIASLYVEEYSGGQREFKISVQDARKAGDAKFPTEFFTIAEYPDIDDSIENKVIPLAYGTIRCSTAYPTNSNASGSTTYRQALVLTSLGTVQVKINDLWVTKTPTSTDLANGSFTLASADSRSGTSVYECRVLGSVGIPVVHASDVIKDINDRYLSVADSSGNYDIGEWAEAEDDLDTIGVVFDEETTIHDAVRRIQNGANVGFRYEMKADGKRTIRIDDDARAESFLISNEEIENINDLDYEVDKEQLAAAVSVFYAPDFNDETKLLERFADNYEYVRDTYRLIPTLEFDTLLVDKATAAERAALEGGRYKDIARIVEIKAMGPEHLGRRIFDTGKVVLTKSFADVDNLKTVGRRPWLGVWKAKIVGIAPDLESRKNTLRLKLVEKLF